MIRIHDAQIDALGVGVERGFAAALAAAIEAHHPDRAARLRLEYAPIERAEGDAADLGPRADMLDHFASDMIYMADLMEIDAPADIAAFTGLMLIAEALPETPPDEGLDGPNPADAAARALLDFAARTLSRPEASGAARMALIERWSGARAAVIPAHAPLQAVLASLREALS